MSYEEFLEFLSRLDPDIARAITSGEVSMEDFLSGENRNQDVLMGFNIERLMITKDKYFEKDKMEIIDRDGQLGTIKTENVWDCGHSQKSYEFGGIDSFGHVVCSECIRYCERGRHLCCAMEAKTLSDGKVVCDYHSGFWRFINTEFERRRVR